MGDGLVMLWVMGWVGLLAVPVAASFTAKAGAEGACKRQRVKSKEQRGGCARGEGDRALVARFRKENMDQ